MKERTRNTEEMLPDGTLQSGDDRMQSMAFDLLQLEEKERRRLAADLHDHVAQTLVLSKIKLKMLSESLSSTVYAGPMDEISELIEQSLNCIRSMTFDLSPPDLYELGLNAALESLCERFHEKYGIAVHFGSTKGIGRMNNETGVLLFRAVQELLFNIVKHAKAHTARIYLEKDGNFIRVNISDDGVGFDPSVITDKNKRTGFGLFSIRERLKGIGGRMDIKSRPGFGTHISIIIPASL